MTALFCVVCFLAMFLFSSMTHATHAGHGNENESLCVSTRMPECKCDNNDNQLLTAFLSNKQAAVYEEFHSHIDSGAACQTCALVCKVVDQLKQSNTAVGSAALTNIDLLSPESLCFSFVQTVPLTPTELKIKITT